jgi:tetratricopeptide (TPR) repeat protein
MHDKDTHKPGGLSKAQSCFQEKKYDACFFHLKDYWLKNFHDVQAVKLFSELMTALEHKDLSKSFAALCTQDDKVTDDPRLLFEAGYRLIDTRQYELAGLVLKECAQIVPDDAALNYELGFVLMLQKKFSEAIPYLERSFAHEMTFDTALNLSACFALCRRMNDARGLLARMVSLAETDEEKAAVAEQENTLKRLEHFAGQADLDSRDWVYTLYGAVLLDEENTSSKLEDHVSIARILILLKEFLKQTLDLTAIEYFNLKARPIAECLAKMLNLTVQSYKGPGQPGKVLTVIANGDDLIGPHRSFLSIGDERGLFIYSLGMEPLPLISELAGKVPDVLLPWDNDKELTDFKANAEKLLQSVSSLEKDEDLKAQASRLSSYYQKKESLLLWRNGRIYPERPQYTAEMP